MNLTQFAQTASSSCTLNGQPIDCAELADKAKPFIGLGIGVLAIIVIVGIASFVFWIFMLVHAIKHNSPNKNAWIIGLIVSLLMGVTLIGALLYFFVEKKKAEQAPAATYQQPGYPPQNNNYPPVQQQPQAASPTPTYAPQQPTQPIVPSAPNENPPTNQSV